MEYACLTSEFALGKKKKKSGIQMLNIGFTFEK